MLKAIYILSAVLITNAAYADTRTVLFSPNQSKTIAQPHASGGHCQTGNVRVSVTKTPKLGSIKITDANVKNCNGKRVTYRSSAKGKDSATIKITYPNGSTKTTKYKLKIK